MVSSFATGNPLAAVTSEPPRNRVFVLSLFLTLMWCGAAAIPSMATGVVPTVWVPEVITIHLSRKRPVGSQGLSVQHLEAERLERLCVS